MPDDQNDSFFLELERVASSLTIADGRESVKDLRDLFDRLKDSRIVSIDIEPSRQRRRRGETNVY